MRLHRLHLEAFGPFASEQVIDFDDVAASGVFLISGPTGAGKTSILDAVCFALYGHVPGVRDDAKRLRSDHAEPGVEPFVELHFTHGGREFVVRRSPSWLRPKKRGEGTTPQNVKVALAEVKHGERVPISSRADEVGATISELLGLTADEFTQVVLLPQGKFAVFLTASDEARKDVLDSLFGMSHFERVVEHLATMKSAAGEKVREVQDGLARHRHAAEDAFRVVIPQVADSSEDTADGSEEVTAAEDDVHDETGSFSPAKACDVLEAECTRLGESQRTADELRNTARSQAMSWEELRGLWRRSRLAQVRQDQLNTETENVDALRGSVTAAESAVALRPVMMRASTAAQAAETASARHESLTSNWQRFAKELEGTTPPDWLDDSLGEQDRYEVWRSEAATATALLVCEQRLATAQNEERRAGKAHETQVVQANKAELAVTSAEGTLNECSRRLEETPDPTDDVAQLTADVESAKRVLDEAREAEKAAHDVDEAKKRVATAYKSASQAESALAKVRQARLASIAGELASTLQDGDACPVCGSVEHPQLAELPPTAPGPDDEEQAEHEANSSRTQLEQWRQVQATAEATWKVASDKASGLDVAQAMDALRDVQTRRDAAHQERIAHAAARQRLDDAREAFDKATRAASSVVEAQAVSAQAHTSAVEAVQEAQAAFDEARAGHACITDRAKVAENAVRLLADVEQSRADMAQRVIQRTDAEEALAEALSTSPFSSQQEATAALVEDRVLSGWRGAIAEHDQAVHHVDGELRTVDELLQRHPLSAQDQTEDVVVEQADIAAQHARECSTNYDDVTSKKARFDAALNTVQSAAKNFTALGKNATELIERYEVVSHLSDVAKGTSPDNRLKMSLSHFVLAARLEAVTAAASHRLSVMSDGRYQLAHSEAIAKGKRKGGLGIEVRDAWTSATRHPSTLSGGEMFLASLALALGLAEVVMAEAGRSDFSTLFVDEGFGHLDPGTLDDVMSVLDELRGGGRVVGVISHVTEMKVRLPHGLEVVKTSKGSAVQPLSGE